MKNKKRNCFLKDLFLLKNNPQKFFEKKKNRFLAGNRYFQRNKNGEKQMLILVLISALIGFTEFLLALFAVSGNIFIAKILSIILILEFFIKLPYVLSICGSLFYAILVSFPGVTGFIGVWNLANRWFLKLKKMQNI